VEAARRGRWVCVVAPWQDYAKIVPLKILQDYQTLAISSSYSSFVL
jgi:hypothetical protein